MTKSNRSAMARAKRLATKRRKEAAKPAAPAAAETAGRPTPEELERAGQLRLIA
jgi:hypothetical protein